MPTPTRSRYLSSRHALNLFRACDFAHHTGRGFNRFVTIAFRDMPLEEVYPAFQAFLDKYRSWLEHKRKLEAVPSLGPASSRLDLFPSYAFVQENQTHPHVHVLFHIPKELESEFDKKFVRWAEKVLPEGGPSDVDAKDLQAREDVKRVANYMMKGLRKKDAKRFFLEATVVYQGETVGKRSGISRNLGPVQQEAIGFVAAIARHQKAAKASVDRLRNLQSRTCARRKAQWEASSKQREASGWRTRTESGPARRQAPSSNGSDPALVIPTDASEDPKKRR